MWKDVQYLPADFTEANFATYSPEKPTKLAR
jgi:hypothetical protein